VTFERLGDIYSRERWADPESPEHPKRTGEAGELPALWLPLQRQLMLYVLRHPRFLRYLPNWFGDSARRLLFSRAHRSASTVVVEEHLEQNV
jgi:hypothetical protein